MTDPNQATIDYNHDPATCPFCSGAGGRWEHLSACRDKSLVIAKSMERIKIRNEVLDIVHAGGDLEEVIMHLNRNAIL